MYLIAERSYNKKYPSFEADLELARLKTSESLRAVRNQPQKDFKALLTTYVGEVLGHLFTILFYPNRSSNVT